MQQISLAGINFPPSHSLKLKTRLELPFPPRLSSDKAFWGGYLLGQCYGPPGWCSLPHWLRCRLLRSHSAPFQQMGTGGSQEPRIALLAPAAPSRGSRTQSRPRPPRCDSPWRRRRRLRCWWDTRGRNKRGCWGAGSSSAAVAADRRGVHLRCLSRGCCPKPSWCRCRRGARTWGCGTAGGRLGKPSAAYRAGVTPRRHPAKGAARSGAERRFPDRPLGGAARGWLLYCEALQRVQGMGGEKKEDETKSRALQPGLFLAFA